MNKLAVSGVNAHMGNTRCACSCKEDDIACLQILFGNGSTLIELRGRSTVRGEAQLLQHIIDKAGAVKTAGRSTAVNIGSTQIFLSLCQNLAAGNTSGGNTGNSGTGRGSAVQCRGTGGNTGGLSAPIELGNIGGSQICVGIFRQLNEIRTDVADLIVVDDFVPAVVQANCLAFAALDTGGHHTMGSGGAGAHIYAGSSDLTVAKLGIFFGGHGQVAFMHVADRQIVMNLIPFPGLADNHNAVIAGGIGKGLGCGVGLGPQAQGGGIDKADAVHNIAGSRCGNGKGACHKSYGQQQGDYSSGNLHT